MIGLGSVASLCQGRGKGSVVLGLLRVLCVRIYVFNYALILLI